MPSSPPAPLGGTDGRRTRVERVCAITLAALAVALPVVVVPAAADSFVLPKLVVLWAGLLIGGVVLVAALSSPDTGPPPLTVDRSVDAPLVVFVVAATLATLLSTDPSRSFVGQPFQYQGLSTLFAYVVVFVMARAAITSASALRRYAVGVLVGAGLVSIYGLAQVARIDPLFGESEYWPRAWSTLGQPNALGALLAVSLPLVLVAPWRRAVRALVAVLLAACLVLTFSRGAYLALASFVPIALLLGPMRRRLGRTNGRRVVLVVVPVVIVATLAVGVLAASAVGNRSADLRDDTSVQLHVDVWKVAMAMTAAHPIVGVGPETFPEQAPQYADDVLSERRARRLDRYYLESPHNLFLATSSGAGVPALVALVVAGAALVVRTWRHMRSRPADALVMAVLLASLAAYAITQCLMTSEISSSLVAASVAGALMGVTSQSRDHAPMA